MSRTVVSLTLLLLKLSGGAGGVLGWGSAVFDVTGRADFVVLVFGVLLELVGGFVLVPLDVPPLVVTGGLLGAGGGLLTVTVRVTGADEPAPFEQISVYVLVPLVVVSFAWLSLPLDALPPPQVPEAEQLFGLFEADQLMVSPAPLVSDISLLALFARTVIAGGSVTVIAGP